MLRLCCLDMLLELYLKLPKATCTLLLLPKICLGMPKSFCSLLEYFYRLLKLSARCSTVSGLPNNSSILAVVSFEAHGLSWANCGLLGLPATIWRLLRLLCCDGWSLSTTSLLCSSLLPLVSPCSSLLASRAPTSSPALLLMPMDPSPVGGCGCCPYDDY